MRLIDLSAPITPDGDDVPEVLRTEIEFCDHRHGAAQVEELFGVGAEHLRNGEGWATETFTRFGTHNSTHVDAPWHYNSTIGGRRARTIDQLPLEWFHAPGVVVDFTAKADGDAITAAEMRDALDAAEHLLQPLDIVLVRTGRDASYGDPGYMRLGPGVSASATQWLCERGVRVMGIDGWGWDRPLYLQAADVAAGAGPGVFWAAHQCDLEYSQIERLRNLGALPPTGFTVCCFPLRIVGASAAPARVVALVPEES
jgi:kynurenine formamidase